MKNLSQCQDGQTLFVRGVSGRGSSYQRLLEMGFIQGSKIKVIRRAPLGDPLEVELHDVRLSINKNQAKAIEVLDA